MLLCYAINVHAAAKSDERDSGRVTNTAKFMKQSGSQGDSECRHDGSHRLEASSRLGWVREDEREGG